MSERKVSHSYSRWHLYIINITLFAIVFSYQACSQNYSLEIKSIELPPKCETGLCKTGQINPLLDQHRPPTKVLFVVDNSRTMELSQGYLANGVKTLANNLRGFDADFSIYSTSDVHIDKTDANGNIILVDDKPVVSSSPFKSCQWTEVVDGKSVVKSGAACPYDQPINYSSELINIMNSNQASHLMIRSSDDEVKFSEQSDQLSSAIKSIGIDGSSTETGICTLVRSIYNDSTGRFFNKGDNAAMVILSDENDSTTPLNCLSKVTKEEKFGGRGAIKEPCDPSVENCNSVEYEVKYDEVKEKSAKVTMNYSCNYQAKKSDCPVGGPCTDGVQYKFSTYKQKVKYSCLLKVPYTVSFKSSPTYSYKLSYQCEKKEDGVSVGLSTLTTVDFADSKPNNCIDGEEVSCEEVSGAELSASQRCLMGTNLYKPTCKLKCVLGENPVLSDKTFDDTDVNAADRDLYAGGVPNLVLTQWAEKNYAGYQIINAVRGSSVSSDSVETFIDYNCSTEDLVGESCSVGDSALTYANSSAACAGMKVTACSKKCVSSGNRNFSLYIGNRVNDDKVDYCTNTNSSFTFYNSKMSSAVKYKNIQDYAYANIYPPADSSGELATVVPGSCIRYGWVKDFTAPDRIISQTALTNSTSKTSCDGNYSSIWDLSWDGSSTSALCHSNTDYHGITDGSVSYGCTEVFGSVIKPKITKTFSHGNSSIGENLCNGEFKVGDITYLNLGDYFRKDPLTGRDDDPSSCKIIDAKKNVTPSGVELISSVEKLWSFPSNVLANDQNISLEDAFISRSTELFGANGFFVSAIIRDREEDLKSNSVCAPLGADQSYGEKYRNLVSLVNSKSGMSGGEVASICSSDYSSALSSVSKWITETARRSYFISELTEHGEILQVSLLREATGEEKTLTLGIDVEAVGSKINIINPNIDLKGWVIKYIYWEPITAN